jgi:hypothetical protein
MFATEGPRTWNVLTKRGMEALLKTLKFGLIKKIIT